MTSVKELRELSKLYTVLYPEDEAMLRESMQKTLEKIFKHVHAAKDGFEALNIFKRESIDILITDINMPILSGTELIDGILQETDKPPIMIVLSAHDESKLLVSLINRGINYFINKPVDKDRMITTLIVQFLQSLDFSLLESSEEQIKKALSSHYYRFQKSEDVSGLFIALKRLM